MSNTKHTPGPWLREGNAVYTLNEREVNHLLVQVHVANGRTAFAEEQEANARLIAAAPDMLAELQTLRAVFIGYAVHHLKNGSIEKGKTNSAHADRIDALIKKATEA